MPVFTPDILDEIRARLSLVDYVGKTVKLTRKGREYWGCCPFHHEKTASFSVSDDRGFYHCFGCGAHGDIFKFEQETNRLNFVEAVQRLAALAGVRLPEDTPRDIAEEKKKNSLYDVLEKACSFYQESLFSPVGQQALLYLQKRGLTEAVIKKFRLGYAPSGNVLRAFFAGQNVSADVLKKAGILNFSDVHNDYYDYFRDRVMFPIMDRKNHVIAFGGRIIGQGEPKYLNSPESPVFSKGSQLYAFNFSVEQARKKRQIIAVEGYMDVISLHASGIERAVAPLGTALTEKQIGIMWKTAEEPVLCFDNDVAGRNAAFRAAERALPLLKAGYSLSFMFTPDGFKDPDEFIKSQGRFAFETLTEKQKIPLSQFLWTHLSRSMPSDTPERRAALERALMQTADKITDPTVQGYYKQEWKNQLWTLTHPSFKPRTNTKNKHQQTAAPATMTFPRVVHPSPVPGQEDERMMMAYILLYPDIASDFLEDISFFVPQIPVLNIALRLTESRLAENPDATRDDIRLFLESENNGALFKMLAPEIEILTKKGAFPQEIRHDIAERLKAFHAKSEEIELEALRRRIVDAPPEEQQKLWNEYMLLQKEKSSLA